MRIKRTRIVLLMLVAIALVAAGCSSDDDGASRDGSTIVIGSANFGESALVAEIYAQALEADGFTVERKFNVGSREIYAPALESGELDLVPEYVGSALTYKGGTATAVTDESARALRVLWAEDGIKVLAAAPAQDKNGFVVTAETASELGLATLSDLTQYSGSLVLGGPPECPEREFCAVGLESVYGFTPSEFKPLDVGGPLTVAALTGGEIDLGLLFTTDGVILQEGFVLLEDDQGLQPAENLIPALRQDIADEYEGAIERVLDEVSSFLSTVDLTAMNKATGYDGEDPAEVAREWLEEKGLVG